MEKLTVRAGGSIKELMKALALNRSGINRHSAAAQAI